MRRESRLLPSLPSFFPSSVFLALAPSFLPQGIYPRYTARSTGYITYRVGTPLVSFDYPRIMRETSRERGLIKSFRFRGKDYRRDFFFSRRERKREDSWFESRIFWNRWFLSLFFFFFGNIIGRLILWKKYIYIFLIESRTWQICKIKWSI